MSAKSNYLGLMNIFQFLLGMTNLYRKVREKYDILNQIDIRLLLKRATVIVTPRQCEDGNDKIVIFYI